ncbi:MAG TPA: hypothetical protein VGM82_08760 [Gemmatimonadaceae bacterium]
MPVSALTRSVTAGSQIAGGLAVKVTDASGNAVVGASVAFSVTSGNGTVNPRVATTDASGQAKTAWTVGTVSGANEVTASVDGVDVPVRFSATGAAGSVASISLSTKRARLLQDVDSLRITAKALDAFGNATSPDPVFTVRDTTLVRVDLDGTIHALRRGTNTYVVVSAGGMIDSALVTVIAAGQSICTDVAAPIELGVGQVLTDISSDGFCVHASSSNNEYALVPFYNPGTANAAIQVQARGQGIATVSASTTLSAFSPLHAVRMPSAPAFTLDYAREEQMRDQERREAARRVPPLRLENRSARGGGLVSGAARRDIIGGSASAATTTPNVGDIVKLNANAKDFCANPDYRIGRVAAVTDKAIVIADTANPVGGFSNDEYRSIGVTFDTLVDPTDRKNFGDPSDIDNNGRVIMFFTRAVNELTVANSSSLFLGFYYQRDLFPRTSGAGSCVGSNVGEMFYLLVPDPAGAVNGNIREQADVISYTLGTVAHEYQHLINASRRMYVNKYGPVFEEKWLDEGLAHSAEDLNFWAASGLSPRSNIDNSVFTNTRAAAAYKTFMQFNQNRYRSYLGATETQGPIGVNDSDDDLFTRGAIWNFLRYSADRLGASNERAFWFSLVNNNARGLANLNSALGTPSGPWLRDWAISNYVDDNTVGSDARFIQPSFNFRSIMTNGGTEGAFPLTTRAMSTTGNTTVAIAGYGVAFLRFSVPSGQDALLTATSLGQSLPSSVQLAIVRVR